MITTKIFDVNIACIDLEGLLKIVSGWVKEGKRRTIYYVNANSLNIVYKNDKFSRILNKSDLVIADGIGAVWGSKILGGCDLQKLTTVDFYPQLFELFSELETSIYILAGRSGVARKAVLELEKNYPKITFLGCADGYFIEKSENNVLQEIKKEKPKILFVGMGTPKQEYWVNNNQDAFPPMLVWSVGALFDYIAGCEKEVPEYLRKINLEWFWRLIMDFSGKWHRYLLGNPLFIFRIMRERFLNWN